MAMIAVAVKISFIGGQNLYIANEPIYLKDGADPFSVTGRLKSPVSSYSIGDLRVSKYEELPLTFQIDNNDGLFDKYLSGGALNVKYWQGATVTLYTGLADESDLTTATVEYTGTISTGGVTERGGYINVTCIPITLTYDVDLASKNINETDYPTAPAFGASIPFRVGDFTGADFVNETALTTELIAPTRIIVNDGSIDNVTVYRNSGGVWADVTGTSTVNNAGGYIDVPVLTADDYFTVACVCNPAAFSGPTSFKVVDVLEWLLTSNGVPASQIDSASFAAALASGDKYEVRRDLLAPSSLYNELSDLMYETGFSLYQTRAGKFGVQFFMPTAGTIVYDFDGLQLADSVTVEHDRDRLYANRIAMTFDEVNGANRSAIDYKDTAEVALFGKEVTAVLNFNWIYTQSSALLSAQRKLFFWSRSPEVVSFVAPFSDNSGPYNVFLLDTIKLSYRRYTNQNVYVRSVDFNFNSGQTQISGYNLASLPTIGVWAYGTHLASAVTVGTTVLPAKFGYNVNVGQLIKIGADDNAGSGYSVVSNTANTITINPAIATNQAQNTIVLPIEQINGAGVWGSVLNGTSWF